MLINPALAALFSKIGKVLTCRIARDGKGSSDRRHSGGFLPQGFGECGNHTVQLAVQHLVDLLDAALLAEGFAIVPKDNDMLTPELRIFALVKLGVSESSKIASLLHYSANTVYNYRAKIKNKSRVPREQFEDMVREIR